VKTLLKGSCVNINAVIGSSPGRLESTWLYPNGGTAASPASVSANSRYVMNNPYPGYVVKCIVQVQCSNKWGTTGFIYSTQGINGRGTAANQLLPDDKIVVQTGSSTLMSPPSSGGNPFGTTDEPTSAPCRVYVEKGGLLP
jgi:hypothetical protein